MSAAEQIEPWAFAWYTAARKGDALLFATDVLGFLLPGEANPDDEPQLEVWQVEALKRFSKAWRNRFKAKGRLSIKSGHGVGKTCFLCIIVLFVLLCAGPDTKIPVVANSLPQLRDGLWPEIAKWRNKLPEELRDQIEWQAEKVFVKAAPEEAFAVRRTATTHRPEALQGIHAKTVLAIFEEASGIPEQTIEAGSGTLSTPGAMAIAVGNPTRASGFFFKTHRDPRMRGVWDCMTVNSEDVLRARGHIDDIIALYGKDSNKYRVRVLGEFPTKDDDVVIPLGLIEAAKGRKVAQTRVWPKWGVSRFGDDRTPLIKRQGNVLLAPPIIWQNLDGNQVAARVIKEFESTPFDLRPRMICVDVIGWGASVVDALRRDDSPVNDIVLAVNVAESASADAKYHRLRDELWFLGREWFRSLDCCIPHEPLTSEQRVSMEALIGELSTPTYDFTATGKHVVCSKKEMKKDLGWSPDLADAFLLSLAGGEIQRDDDRYRSRRHRHHDEDTESAWGA